MYDLRDYARMAADPARSEPYVRALEATVRPGAVVVDLGAGTGVFSLVACRLGARKVYAVETNDAIQVGRALARENHCEDRVVFLQGDARRLELPERAGVIVSDLRGMLPLCGDHLEVLAHARERWLAPGGVLIPARDRLLVAAVSHEALYERALGPPAGPLGVSLGAMRAQLANLPCPDRGPHGLLRPEHLLTPAAVWATLDYASLPQATVSGQAELTVQRAGLAHGLVVWFDADLHAGEGFSSGPGHDNSYGRLFLPWPEATSVALGEAIDAKLWAKADGELWGWNARVRGSSGERASFRQSSFLAETSRPAAAPLRRAPRG